MPSKIPTKLCVIDFDSNKLDRIIEIINHAQPRIREEIARQVCAAPSKQSKITSVLAKN